MSAISYSTIQKSVHSLLEGCSSHF